MKHRELRGEVAEVARRLIASGLVTGTSGNVSARTPEGDVLVTPTGLPYEEMEPEHVVLVSVDGDHLEGELEFSSETPMHTGIYRAQPNVGAVVHTHSRFATTLACLGLEIPPVHYMLTTLSKNGRIPLAPYALFGTEDLAENAAGALGESSNACLLRTHGAITVGESPEKAFARTVTLEEMAEVYYRARLAGEPILLNEDEVDVVAAKISGYGYPKSRSGTG
ncbi:L-fuculose-phosphate aldolase [soil metagenome]